MSDEKYAKHQATLDKIAAQQTNALWADNFGGLTTDEPTPRRDNFPDLIATGLPKGYVSDDEMMRDPEILAEIERRDPKFKKQQDEKRMDAATNAFKLANPDYVPNAKNYEAICKYIRNTQLKDPLLDLQDEFIEEAYKKGFWTVENLTAVFETLKAKGRMDLPPAVAKELTREEMITVAAHIRRGDAVSGISQYLAFALPNNPAANLPTDVFAIQYPQLFHRCVYDIFRLAHPELNAEEWTAFKRSTKHIALPTIAVLETILNQRNEERLLGKLGEIRTGPAQTVALPPEPEQPKQYTDAALRAMPEDELNRLIQEERKAARRQIYSL